MCSISVQSQDIKATEVRVTEGFKPSVPEANKLNEQASFADTLKVDKSQTYSVNQYNLKTNFKTRPLKAAKVKDESISKLYDSQASIGFGDNWNKRFSFLYNSKRSIDLNYGLFLQHISNQYKPENYQVKNSQNIFTLYGKKITSSHIFIANLEYDRRTALYFDMSSPEEEKYFRNRFTFSKVSMTAINKNNTESLIKKVNFFLSDFNEMSENQVHLSADLEKEIHSMPINIEIEFNNFLNYNNKDSRYEPLDLKELHFVPQASFNKIGINFQAGLNFHYDPYGVAVSPLINATKELVKDILLISGGIRHNEERHTLKTISDVNPYIHTYGSNQAIISGNGFLQELKSTAGEELFFSMRNKLGANEVFEGSIAYGQFTDFANFIGLDNGDYYRFFIDYLDLKQLQISLDYTRVLNDVISVDAQADYFNWNEEVYYKPNLTIVVSTPINLRDKIRAVPSINYMASRIAQHENILVNEPVIRTELPAQFHANFMLVYNYSKILSAYLQLNNLTNSKEVLFKGYQEIGFNGVFGINYSF